MFDPPFANNWIHSNSYDVCYLEAYCKGYKHAQNKGLESDNPYIQSGLERETAWDDERHYWWYSGFNDYEEARKITDPLPTVMDYISYEELEKLNKNDGNLI